MRDTRNRCIGLALLALAVTSPAGAQPPLLREIASTAIPDGFPVGIAAAADSSIYLLVEASLDDSGAAFDPKGQGGTLRRED